MTEDEGRVAALALLIKINIITGWSFPVNEDHQSILTDQFQKMLIEKYPTLNVDEMEYAFRNNLAIDWGKNINLNLIDEVMQPYLDRRFEVSMKEQQVKTKPKELPTTEEISDEDFLSSNKFVYHTSKKFQLVSAKCYDILIKQGKLKRPEGEERERIMKTARANFFNPENKDYTNVLSHDEIERFITQDCKKISVCEFWNNEKN